MLQRPSSDGAYDLRGAIGVQAQAVNQVCFSHVELRTTAPAEAAAFYNDVLGPGPRSIVELPSRARALGAPPHWLGTLGVAAERVDDDANALISRGAQRLGPPGAGAKMILRGPGGAIVALGAEEATAPTGVVWHHLNAAGAARASASLAAALGWSFGPVTEAAGAPAVQEFAWREGQTPVGSVADVAGRPGVHTHWMFFFGVRGLDDALARARARGAVVIGPTWHAGARVAVCDDPQGAAFGLLELDVDAMAS